MRNLVNVYRNFPICLGDFNMVFVLFRTLKGDVIKVRRRSFVALLSGAL